MITGKTSSGFEYAIEDHVMDNMELLDILVEADENPAALPKIINLIFTNDQKRGFYDHLRTEHGNVPILAVANEITEIFNSNQRGKN